MNLGYATHPYASIAAVACGQYGPLSFITREAIDQGDYKGPGGAVVTDNELQDLLSHKQAFPLPTPQPLEEGKGFVVNCVGGVYYVDKAAFAARETMQPIGEFIMTHRDLVHSN